MKTAVYIGICAIVFTTSVICVLSEEVVLEILPLIDEEGSRSRSGEIVCRQDIDCNNGNGDPRTFCDVATSRCTFPSIDDCDDHNPCTDDVHDPKKNHDACIHIDKVCMNEDPCYYGGCDPNYEGACVFYMTEECKAAKKYLQDDDEDATE